MLETMAIYWLKLIALVLIFITAFIGGLLPGMWAGARGSRRALLHGDFFARGVFLGAGLIHLLPDALDSIAAVLPQFEYPLVFTVCASTVFIVQFIEQGLVKFCRFSSSNHKAWLPYLLMVLLSVHSVIAGAALGLGDTLGHIAIIFLAIIAHKGAAAFALGSQMGKADIDRGMIKKILFVFACMTPVGIILGGVFYACLQSGSAHVAEGIFNAVASGTFLYIALSHRDEVRQHGCSPVDLVDMVYFGLGIVLMAVVAIWL